VRLNGAGTFGGETIATRLRSSGWRTGAFIGAFVLDHRFGLARGFDSYDDGIIRDPNDDSTSALEAQRRGSEVVDSALAWLRREDLRPFFAWVHLYDAHAPYEPPAPLPQTYDGEIRYVDQQVGRLLAAIDRKNTIVAIVGDHGEALGEHGEPTHGLLLYDATLRVPMIVAAPSTTAYRVTEAVSTADLAPTLAQRAGAPFVALLDGRALADDLHARRQPQRAHVHSEAQYPLSFGWNALSAVRSGPMKLIVGASPELYDVALDPRETMNVLSSDRRAYADLRSSLDAILKTEVASAANTVDAETRAKLASLGYIAPQPAGGGSRREPKEMLPLFLDFERATVMLNAGRPRDALPLLERVAREDPANRLFLSSLARAMRSLGRNAEAVERYRKAVALAPHDADTWYNLAATLQEAGELREARVAIAEALRLEPSRPEAHNTLGVIEASSGNLAAAADEFRTVIISDRRNARAYNNLGNVLRGLGRTAEATDAYRRASELAPSYPDPLNGMGVMLVQQGRAREAIPYFDAAVRLAPAFYEARLNRAIALQMAGDESTARQELTALLTALPRGRMFDGQRRAAQAVLGTLRTEQ
jgi:Flp pilus assembly protein TadD